jgi:hypothetical protein
MRLPLLAAVLLAASAASAQELPCGPLVTVDRPIQWVPPANPGSGITRYDLELAAGGDAGDVIQLAAVALMNGVYTTTVPGLATDVTWMLRLAAVGPGGTSPWSAPLIFPATSRGLCATPTAPLALAPGTVAPPPPPANAKPDATNTGPAAGIELRSCPAGEQRVSVDGCIFDGAIWLGANNVTISNSIVNAKRAGYGISTAGSTRTGTVLRNVEVFNADSKCVYIQGGFAGDKLHLHDCEDGVYGDNITLTNSYVHDSLVGGGRHSDGMQTPNIGKVVLRGNRFVGKLGMNSDLFLQSNWPPGVDDVLVEGKWFEGTVDSYTIYCDNKNGVPLPTRVRFKNNVIARGGNGYTYMPCRSAAGFEWENNRDPNGAVVVPQG